MKDLKITLSDDIKSIVSEADVRHMLKALDKSFYVDELHIDSARLRILMEKARAVEANRNRFIETWEIAFKKLG